MKIWPLALGINAAIVTAGFAVPFVPGDDRIQEAEILERIQREIGQDLRSIQAGKVKKKAAAKSAASTPPTLRLQLRSSNGKEVSGNYLLQNQGIRLQTATGFVDLSLMDMASVTFEKFIPSFVHYLEEKKKARIFFLPDQCRAELRNGTVIEGTLVGRQLLQIRIQGEGLERTYSAFFWIEVDQSGPPSSEQEMQALLSRQAPEPPDLVKTIAVMGSPTAASSVQNED